MQSGRVLVLILAVLFTLHQTRADHPPPLLPETALLLPGSGGRGTRSPVFVDPIQADRLDASMPTIKAGDVVKMPDGSERIWEALKRSSANVWKHDRLPGGYLRLEIVEERERIVMLEVAGHLHTWINSEPRAADPYGNGIVRLPILLRKGVNELLLQPRQREIAVNLKAPASEFLINTSDPTVPDLIIGESGELWAAAPVVNATTKTAAGLRLRATVVDGKPMVTPVASIAPLGVFKAPFRFAAHSVMAQESKKLKLELLRPNDDVLATAELSLRVRRPEQEQMRTFVSRIDRSVQYYSVVRANPSQSDPRPGLTLTLHGAGVEGRGQAACYQPKPWTHIVAPTNRRPFGFDWEDWGRLDALEVLDEAERELTPDPRRRWLTGHSMGGHGAWHLGATFPDRFAAIGPSAGWISMFTYAGMRRPENPDPLVQMLQRASSPSDTLALVRNMHQHGIYVLHGEKDDNVPIGQSRTMKQALEKFHPDLAYHEQPGAGHWWGNDCVDWKPMFEFFAKRTRPEPKDVRKVEFVTASPHVSADCHWLRIEQPQKFLEISGVEIECDSARHIFFGTTRNVARLSFDVRHLSPDRPISVRLDGQDTLTIPWPASAGRIWLRRDGEKWTSRSAPQAGEKGPHRFGPFKEAFRNRMIFVYGTKGAAIENAAMLAKARFDAETFWYRGNGGIEVMADTEFVLEATRDRNVILYGNADTNAAWPKLLADSPVQVANGKVRVGARTIQGDDLACIWVRPRRDSDTACVAVIAGSGVRGLRTLNRLPIFVSGIAYPDFVLLTADALRQGANGYRAAGFFGPDWSVENGEFVWRDDASPKRR